MLVLKGHRTVTAAPDGRAWINTTGNPGMSKGGSGDVLAGLILALLGQGWEPELAARDGVYLHGEAGGPLRRKPGGVRYDARGPGGAAA